MLQATRFGLMACFIFKAKVTSGFRLDALPRFTMQSLKKLSTVRLTLGLRKNPRPLDFASLLLIRGSQSLLILVHLLHVISSSAEGRIVPSVT